MSRSIEEIQNDIRTLTRVPSLFIDQKLNELADEVRNIYEQGRADAIDEFVEFVRRNWKVTQAVVVIDDGANTVEIGDDIVKLLDSLKDEYFEPKEKANEP